MGTATVRRVQAAGVAGLGTDEDVTSPPSSTSPRVVLLPAGAALLETVGCVTVGGVGTTCGADAPTCGGAPLTGDAAAPGAAAGLGRAGGLPAVAGDTWAQAANGPRRVRPSQRRVG